MAESNDPLHALDTKHLQVGAETFDIVRLYAGLLRRWWLIAITFVATVIGTAVWTSRQVPVYRADASIVIDLTPPQVLKNVPEVVDLGSGNFWSTKEYFETQYRIMKSRAVAEQVIARLGLDHDYDYLHIDPRLDENAKAQIVKNMDIPERVMNSLLLVPVRDSRVVNIGIEDTNPQRAADLANAVAEEYIEQNVERKLVTSHGASAWLAGQLSALRHKMEEAEKALYQFKEQNHKYLIAGSGQGLINQRVSMLGDELLRAEVERVRQETRIESLKESLEKSKDLEIKAESFPKVFENQLVNVQRETLARLETDRSELAERYQPGHPKLISLERRVTDVKNRLKHAIQVVLDSIDSEYRQKLEENRRYQSMFGEAKQQALEMNRLEVQYDRLRRDKDLTQGMFDTLLKRQREIDIAGLLRTNNIRLLDRALVPGGSVRPNKRLNLSLGALVGLLLGLAMASLLELLDRTVKSQDDIEKGLGLPLLGILPTIPGGLSGQDKANTIKRDLHVSVSPTSAVSECARAIRTSLLFASPDRPFKILLVASTGPREGKTTAATSIGITMAQSGNRVLLVDGDLRRPRLHHTFDCRSNSGLSTVILGESSLEEAIKPTGVERLFLLPAGPVPPNPAELLQSERCAEVLRTLADRFDRVIVDSPPLGVVTDALIMSTRADGLVLVLRAGKTPKKLAHRGRRTLLDVKAHIYGAVLNDVDLGSRTGQYYYYYYRYGYYPNEEPKATASTAS